MEHKVARFRQLNVDNPHVHHDALEFPGGHVVMVTRLVAGQTATVLQLPASAQDNERVKGSQLILRIDWMSCCRGTGRASTSASQAWRI